jgi:hypothetical protein
MTRASRSQRELFPGYTERRASARSTRPQSILASGWMLESGMLDDDMRAVLDSIDTYMAARQQPLK